MSFRPLTGPFLTHCCFPTKQDTLSTLLRYLFVPERMEQIKVSLRLTSKQLLIIYNCLIHYQEHLETTSLNLQSKRQMRDQKDWEIDMKNLYCVNCFLKFIVLMPIETVCIRNNTAIHILSHVSHISVSHKNNPK